MEPEDGRRQRWQHLREGPPGEFGTQLRRRRRQPSGDLQQQRCLRATRHLQHLERGDKPYHSVPASRSAIDDPANKGMVMAPFMYRYLSESEYEHMTKCATDVVQWRVDKAVFLGEARAVGAGGRSSRPRCTSATELSPPKSESTVTTAGETSTAAWCGRESP